MVQLNPSLLKGDPPFGLHCGQKCKGSLAHNSGWYNQCGERIGWGDLTVHHMNKISYEIGWKELFIVLPELASFSRHQTAFYQRKLGREFNEEAPGLDHIIAKATFIINRFNIYMVERCKPGDEHGSFYHEGIKVKLLLDRYVRKMLIPSWQNR